MKGSIAAFQGATSKTGHRVGNFPKTGADVHTINVYLVLKY